MTYIGSVPDVKEVPCLAAIQELQPTQVFTAVCHDGITFTLTLPGYEAILSKEQ